MDLLDRMVRYVVDVLKSTIYYLAVLLLLKA